MKQVKIILDSIMLILLPLLMAYSLIGESIHEWLGITMFAVFILHHILNHKWLKSIFKGKYTPYRIYITVVNILLCVIMLALPISGILMSKHAVPFLSIRSGTSYARTIHMTTAYWGFVLMSIHFGNHIDMMLNSIKRKLNTKKTVIKKLVCSLFTVLICSYGFYAFIQRRIAEYLFMKVMFAFFDYSESKLKFFADHIAMMLAFAVTGHYICKILKKSNNWLNHKKSPGIKEDTK